MVRDNVQARRRLDARFLRLRPLADEPRPHKGWIRAIRDALGMSSTELAARIGVSQQRVPQMERSELQDTITLGTLRRVAEAL
ncbi:MAG: helix-turn-helix domain-containing protein, partial [Acidimicrobiia bacterium]